MGTTCTTQLNVHAGIDPRRPWYNGLQLCDHINGSYPVDNASGEGGTLREWQQMLAAIKPMRFMMWFNAAYVPRTQVWKLHRAPHTLPSTAHTHTRTHAHMHTRTRSESSKMIHRCDPTL